MNAPGFDECLFPSGNLGTGCSGIISWDGPDLNPVFHLMQLFSGNLQGFFKDGDALGCQDVAPIGNFNFGNQRFKKAA